MLRRREIPETVMLDLGEILLFLKEKKYVDSLNAINMSEQSLSSVILLRSDSKSLMLEVMI